MDKEQLLKMYAALKNNPGEIVKAAARHRLINFARYMQPDLTLEPFHVVYYTLLDKFAHGEIKKMIVQAINRCYNERELVWKGSVELWRKKRKYWSWMTT